MHNTNESYLTSHRCDTNLFFFCNPFWETAYFEMSSDDNFCGHSAKQQWGLNTGQHGEP
jgi:hypothetical protein